MANVIKDPFGASQDVTIAVTGATAVTINKNAINQTIPTLTGNATVTITAHADLEVGTEMSFIIKTTATETFTVAGDIVGPVVTGVAGKTWSQGYKYNGTKFYPVGAKIQVD